ncbi:CRTAC1 family protein [Alteromonas gracilis]|uniref:CRTAC1 family protein n=1 Tax=Alteromonas gracilis TaxID=1479524 RepID=UPI003736C568
MKKALSNNKVLTTFGLASVVCLSLYLIVVFTFSTSSKSLIPNNFQTEHTPVQFVESAFVKGIVFKHIHRTEKLSGIKDALGSGVCVIDFNQDGYEDLFIVGGEGVTRRYGKKHWWNNPTGSKLYQNIAGQYFTDVTTLAGEAHLPGGYGCAVGDLNDDGYPELAYGKTNELLLLTNQNGITFSRSTIGEIPKPYWPLSITIWDHNQDGKQDILVANFLDYENDIKIGNQEYGYETDSQFDAKNYNGLRNAILLNKGVQTSTSTPLFETLQLSSYDRTLSIIPKRMLTENKSASAGYYIANGSGSNSDFIGFGDNQSSDLFTKLLSFKKSPNVQLSSIKVEDKTALLFIPFGGGSTQLHFVGEKVNKDRAWQLFATSDKDASVQTWGAIVEDLNNDGSDDFIIAKGNAAPHIDTPYLPVGNINSGRLQVANGQFEPTLFSQFPTLKRSSRGIASADFDNDGKLDYVVNNNNGVLSLYMNHTDNNNNWISFNCQPINLCNLVEFTLNAESNTQLATKTLVKPQPFLSSSQRRVHFGLGQFDSDVSLNVTGPDNKYIFENLALNNVYQLNLTLGKIDLISKKTKRHTDSIEASHYNLFAYIDLPLNELIPALSQTIEPSLSSLLTFARQLNHDKFVTVKTSQARSQEVVTLISWLFNQMQRFPPSQQRAELYTMLIELISKTESDLFVEHLDYLIRSLPETQFCQLTDTLNYWFWEEEVAPLNKPVLKSQLLHRALKTPSESETICALHALSASEDPTIGASLMSFLHREQQNQHASSALIASVVRTIGFLKYRKALAPLTQICSNVFEPVLKAECVVTLTKLNVERDRIKTIVERTENDELVFRLHTDRLTLQNVFGSPTRTESTPAKISWVNTYLNSTLFSHFSIAHTIDILSATTEQDKLRAISQLNRLRSEKDIERIALKMNQLGLSLPEDYSRLLLKHYPDQSWFIPFLTSQSLKSFFENQDLNQYSLAFQSALSKECRIRASLTAYCEHRFEPDMKRLRSAFSSILEDNPMALSYLMQSDSKVKKRVVINQLARAARDTSKEGLTGQSPQLTRIFEFLYLQHSYTNVSNNQENIIWVDSFIRYAQTKGYVLDSQWLQHYVLTLKKATDSLAL